jgi:hypothetical protein
MNLKTHTGYPETMIDGDTFAWVSNILDGGSSEQLGPCAVLDTKSGEADSYSEARDQASAWVESVADDYLKPEDDGESMTITADDVGTIEVGE